LGKIAIYASKGPAKRTALLRRLTCHRISNNDIREYIDKFIELYIVDKLDGMNINIYKYLQIAMLK